MSSRSEGPSDEKENAIKAAAAGGLGLSTPEASGKLKGVDATASVNGKVAKFLEETRKVDTSTFKVETRREMYMLRYKDEKRTMRELAEEGASMVSMVLGESRGLRVRQNPRIMTQPKNDKPAHLGMVKYVRDEAKDPKQMEVLARLDQHGFRIAEGIEGATSIMPVGKGTEVGALVNYLGVAIHEWFHAFPDVRSTFFYPEMSMVEDGFRYKFENGDKWGAVTIGISMAIEPLLAVLQWFYSAKESPRLVKYQHLECPFMFDGSGETVIFSKVLPHPARFGGGMMVPSFDLTIKLDVFVHSDVPSRFFMTEGGAALVRAAFGEQVLEVDVKQGRDFKGSQVFKLLMTVAAVAESRTLKQIDKQTAMSNGCPKRVVYETDRGDVTAYWLATEETARAFGNIGGGDRGGGGGNRESSGKQIEAIERLTLAVSKQQKQNEEHQKQNLELQRKVDKLASAQQKACEGQARASSDISILAQTLDNFMKGTASVLKRLPAPEPEIVEVDPDVPEVEDLGDRGEEVENDEGLDGMTEWCARGRREIVQTVGGVQGRARVVLTEHQLTIPPDYTQIQWSFAAIDSAPVEEMEASWVYEKGHAQELGWSMGALPRPAKERDKRVDSCLTWGAALDGRPRMEFPTAWEHAGGGGRRAPCAHWCTRRMWMTCIRCDACLVHDGVRGSGGTGDETVFTVMVWSSTCPRCVGRIVLITLAGNVPHASWGRKWMEVTHYLEDQLGGSGLGCGICSSYNGICCGIRVTRSACKSNLKQAWVQERNRASITVQVCCKVDGGHCRATESSDGSQRATKAAVWLRRVRLAATVGHALPKWHGTLGRTGEAGTAEALAFARGGVEGGGERHASCARAGLWGRRVDVYVRMFCESAGGACQGLQTGGDAIPTKRVTHVGSGGGAVERRANQEVQIRGEAIEMVRAEPSRGGDRGGSWGGVSLGAVSSEGGDGAVQGRKGSRSVGVGGVEVGNGSFLDRGGAGGLAGGASRDAVDGRGEAAVGEDRAMVPVNGQSRRDEGGDTEPAGKGSGGSGMGYSREGPIDAADGGAGEYSAVVEAPAQGDGADRHSGGSGQQGVRVEEGGEWGQRDGAVLPSVGVVDGGADKQMAPVEAGLDSRLGRQGELDGRSGGGCGCSERGAAVGVCGSGRASRWAKEGVAGDGVVRIGLLCGRPIRHAGVRCVWLCGGGGGGRERARGSCCRVGGTGGEGVWQCTLGCDEEGVERSGCAGGGGCCGATLLRMVEGEHRAWPAVCAEAAAIARCSGGMPGGCGFGVAASSEGGDLRDGGWAAGAEDGGRVGAVPAYVRATHVLRMAAVSAVPVQRVRQTGTEAEVVHCGHETGRVGGGSRGCGLGQVDPCRLGGAARRSRRRWQRLMHALHGNGDVADSPTYSPVESEDEDEVERELGAWDGRSIGLRTAHLQRVGPSWDVGWAVDRAEGCAQFVPTAEGDGWLALPAGSASVTGALALEAGGGQELTKRCVTVLVLQHPVMFWGYYGSRAVAERLVASMEGEVEYSFGDFLHMMEAEYRRIFDVEALVRKLFYPMKQLWQAHRVQHQVAAQRESRRLAGCLTPGELLQHAERVIWVYDECRVHGLAMAVGDALLRQHFMRVEAVQSTLERLSAALRSAAWRALTDDVKYLVMCVVTYSVEADWQFRDGFLSQRRDAAEAQLERLLCRSMPAEAVLSWEWAAETERRAAETGRRAAEAVWLAAREEEAEEQVPIAEGEDDWEEEGGWDVVEGEEEWGEEEALGEEEGEVAEGEEVEGGVVAADGDGAKEGAGWGRERRFDGAAVASVADDGASDTSDGWSREGWRRETTIGSMTEWWSVGFHDVRVCSRCGNDCSDLYPVWANPWPTFEAVPCLRCGWDTGLEWGKNELAEACDFRMLRMQVGEWMVLRGLPVELCMRILERGVLQMGVTRLDAAERTVLVARLSRVAVGDVVRNLCDRVVCGHGMDVELAGHAVETAEAGDGKGGVRFEGGQVEEEVERVDETARLDDGVAVKIEEDGLLEARARGEGTRREKLKQSAAELRAMLRCEVQDGRTCPSGLCTSASLLPARVTPAAEAWVWNARQLAAGELLVGKRARSATTDKLHWLSARLAEGTPDWVAMVEVTGSLQHLKALKGWWYRRGYMAVAVPGEGGVAGSAANGIVIAMRRGKWKPGAPQRLESRVVGVSAKAASGEVVKVCVMHGVHVDVAGDDGGAGVVEQLEAGRRFVDDGGVLLADFNWVACSCWRGGGMSCVLGTWPSGSAVGRPVLCAAAIW